MVISGGQRGRQAPIVVNKMNWRVGHSWAVVSCKGRAGLVEPATAVQVIAPSKEGYCGWDGSRNTFPGPMFEAPIGIIKREGIKETCN